MFGVIYCAMAFNLDRKVVLFGRATIAVGVGLIIGPIVGLAIANGVAIGLFGGPCP